MLENQHNKVRVYSPGGTGDNFFAIWKSIFKEFPLSHGLGFRLASRNITARYRRSLLGIFWAFLPPLATSVVWIILDNQRIVNFASTEIPYPVFVVLGTTLWQVFTSSVLIPLQTVNANKPILTKINFPREAVLVNAFYEILFTVFIGAVIVVLMLLFTGTNPGWSGLLYIPFVLQLMLIGMTISLFLLPVSLLFQDIQFVLPSVLQFVMYLTPVIYPKPFFSSFGWLFKYNPVGQSIQFIRSGLTGTANDVLLSDMLLTFGVTSLFFIVGIVLYRITMEVLIERMGS